MYRNVKFLKKIAKCSKSKRDKLLLSATHDQLHCLSEIAYNTLKGNLDFKNHSVKKLKRFKNEIRKLAKKSTALKKKKELLTQRGGFIPLLLSPIISALVSGAISKVITNTL